MDNKLNFKIFEAETGTPGPIPTDTEDYLKKQLKYWKNIEVTTTDPIVQQKATDKVNAITELLDRY